MDSVFVKGEVNFAAIPSYLKGRKQWLLWRFEQNSSRSKPTKVPYQPDGRKAKSNDPRTWSNFETCLKALQSGGFDGLGFAFAEGDGLTGIDLDHCYDDMGELEPWAKEIVDQFVQTYIEKTPSNEGLHIWCFGKPLKTGQKNWEHPDTGAKRGIEIYDYTSARYFTVTGNILEVKGQSC
jgi:putative DNA primase/helicase